MRLRFVAAEQRFLIEKTPRTSLVAMKVQVD
jgi:hypothetical protein